MNQKQAFRETLIMAAELDMPLLEGTSYGLDHLFDMWETIQKSDFSESKLGRWLGWAQCAVVVSGVATLEDMKEINLRNA